MKLVKPAKFKQLPKHQICCCNKMLFKFHRCSENMRSTICCTHVNAGYPFPLWRNYRMRARSESSQLAVWEYCDTSRSRQSNDLRVLIDGEKLPLWNVTKVRIVTARFANLGDLNEIWQHGCSRWHSMFCESYLFPFPDIWHSVTFRSQFSAPKMLRPGMDVPPVQPLVAPLYD